MLEVCEIFGMSCGCDLVAFVMSPVCDIVVAVLLL